MQQQREVALIVLPLRPVPDIPAAARPGRARDAAPVSFCAAILHVERATDSLQASMYNHTSGIIAKCRPQWHLPIIRDNRQR